MKCKWPILFGLLSLACLVYGLVDSFVGNNGVIFIVTVPFGIFLTVTLKFINIKKFYKLLIVLVSTVAFMLISYFGGYVSNYSLEIFYMICYFSIIIWCYTLFSTTGNKLLLEVIFKVLIIILFISIFIVAFGYNVYPSTQEHDNIKCAILACLYGCQFALCTYLIVDDFIRIKRENI